MHNLHNLRRRVDALKQGAGTGDREAVDVTVHHVHAGGVTVMTPSEWEQYRREHSDYEFITVREVVTDGDGCEFATAS